MKKAVSVVLVTLNLLFICILTACKEADEIVTTTAATEITTQPAVLATSLCDDASAGEELVWITQSGSKYHRTAECSNMGDPREIKISCALSAGYMACKYAMNKKGFPCGSLFCIISSPLPTGSRRRRRR